MGEGRSARGHVHHRFGPAYARCRRCACHLCHCPASHTGRLWIAESPDPHLQGRSLRPRARGSHRRPGRCRLTAALGLVRRHCARRAPRRACGGCVSRHAGLRHRSIEPVQLRRWHHVRFLARYRCHRAGACTACRAALLISPYQPAAVGAGVTGVASAGRWYSPALFTVQGRLHDSLMFP